MTAVSNSRTKADAIVTSREAVGQAPTYKRICHTPDFYMSACESHHHILKYTQNENFVICRGDGTVINYFKL